MKTTLLPALALTVLGAVAAEAQRVTDLDDLVRRGGAYLHPETLEPFSGAVESSWEATGMTREKGVLVDGWWDGVHEWFHVNGALSTRETWSNGRLNGPSRSYFKNGTLSVSETYVNGRLDGAYEAYWTRGWLAEKGRWEAGQPCGEWLSFGRNVTYPPCRGGGE